MAPVRPNRRSRKKQCELVPINLPTAGTPGPTPFLFSRPQQVSSVACPPVPDLPVVQQPNTKAPKTDSPFLDPPKAGPAKTDPPASSPPQYTPFKMEPPKIDSAKVEGPQGNLPKSELAARFPPITSKAHSLYHSTTSRPLADPPNAGPPASNPPIDSPVQLGTPKDSSTDAPLAPDDEEEASFRRGFTYRAADMSIMDSNGRNQIKVEFWLGTPEAHFINLDLRPGTTPGYTMNDANLTFRMYNKTTSSSGVTTFDERIFHSEPDTIYCLHPERGLTYGFDNIPGPDDDTRLGMPPGSSLRMMKDRLEYPKMDTPLYHTSTPQASSSAKTCREYITPLQLDPRAGRYPVKVTAAANNANTSTTPNDWAERSSPLQFTPSPTVSIASDDDEEDNWPAGFIPERLLYHPAIPGAPNELGAFIAAHEENRIFERCRCGELITAGEDHCSVEAGTDRLMKAVGLDIQDDYSVAKRIAMDFFVGHEEGAPIHIDASWYKLDPNEYIQATDKYADVMRRNALSRHMDDMEDRVMRATSLELVKVGSITNGKGRGLNAVSMTPGSMDFATRDVVENGAELVLDAGRWGLDFANWFEFEDAAEEVVPFFYGTYDSDDELMEEVWRGIPAF
ncbi:hypothetical protein DFP73DRAFT_591970 [Morchella snyderi]|nr:hypothetical protein DFP73DRAFT_591970 [Morchella snyderi]